MRSNVCSTPHPADEAAAEAAADADLAALLDAVETAERAVARAVGLAGRVSGSGAAERVHGLPVDLVLAERARLTGGDRHMLLTAGQVLDTMPELAQAHRDGRVSWGQVRSVVALLRRRSLADRAVIDAGISSALEGGAADPDGLVEAVGAAVAELAGRRGADDADRRGQLRNRLWAQLALDGRVTGGFDYDAVSGAVVLGALAAAQGRPAADDPGRPPEVPTRQQRSAAAALVDVCKAFLGGGAGRRARPAYVVGIDAEALDAALPGRLRLRLRGRAPRIAGRRVAADAAEGADVRVVVSRRGAPAAVTARAATDQADLDLEQAGELVAALGVRRGQRAGMTRLVAAVLHALEASSDVQRVLEGQRPLCDPGMLDAADIPSATRIAVAARDGGCRFLGCAAPVDWCDIHHLDPRARGGDHHPDRLVLVCRRDHRTTHTNGWTLTLDPPSGTVTARRGDQSWQTLPRGSPLATPPPAPRGPDPPPPAPGPEPPTAAPGPGPPPPAPGTDPPATDRPF